MRSPRSLQPTRSPLSGLDQVEVAFLAWISVWQLGGRLLLVGCRLGRLFLLLVLERVSLMFLEKEPGGFFVVPGSIGHRVGKRERRNGTKGNTYMI